MKAYKLLKDVPGLKAGAVFVHDKHDSNKGSISNGCLKLAWNRGWSQFGWCAGTYIFPGQLIDNTEWFLRVKNDKTDINGQFKKRYTC